MMSWGGGREVREGGREGGDGGRQGGDGDEDQHDKFGVYNRLSPKVYY